MSGVPGNPNPINPKAPYDPNNPNPDQTKPSGNEPGPNPALHTQDHDPQQTPDPHQNDQAGKQPKP